MADETKVDNREKELLEKIAQLSSENEELVKKVSTLEGQIKEIETLKSGVEARDSLLWSRFENDVNKAVPEKMREMFSKDNFSNPVEAFSSLNVFIDMMKALKEEVAQEKTEKPDKKDNPTKQAVSSDGIEYKGDSRVEALKLLTKLNQN